MAEDRWTIIVTSADGTAREIHVSARRAGWIRAGVITAIAAFVALSVGFGLTYPRSRAYGELLQENLAMKLQLAQLDERMTEIDGVLLRLRLYDAQLEGLTPKGSHGPIDIDAIPDGWIDPDRAPASEDADEEDRDHGPEAWGRSLVHRADAFLDVFHRVEPDLTRMFGELEDLRAIEAALPSRWPTRGILSSDYGWRRNPFSRRRWKFHAGVDIANTAGTRVDAVARGAVIRAQWVDGFGKAVEIDHGFGITTVYGHNSRLYVSIGDRVEVGDRIASMGSTGRSTGPHSHFELRIDGNPVDPRDYLKGLPKP